MKKNYATHAMALSHLFSFNANFRKLFGRKKQFCYVVRLSLLALGILLSQQGSAQPYIYSQAFTGGVTPTTQCTAWTTYCAALPSSGISYFNISSSITATNYQCNTAATAQAIANAMRTASATTLASDGHTWYVGTGCGSGCGGLGAPVVELAVDQGTCACGSTATVRPAINNGNWGGIGSTCGAPSQTLTVSFSTGVWYSSTAGGDASNMNNWWSNSNNTGFHPPSTTNNANDVWVVQGPMTSTAAQTYAGSIIINSGASFTPLTGSTLNIGGSFTNNGTFTSNSGTVNFNGTVSQVISGASTTSFNNVIVNNTSFPLHVNSNINVAGTLTVNANTTVTPVAAAVINNAAAAGTITGSGTVQVSTITGGANLASQYKFSTYSLGSMTLDYTGAGAQNVDAFSVISFTGAVKTSTSGTKTLAGNIVTGNVTIGSGTTLDASASNFSIQLGGNWANNGSFNARSGTVLFASGTAGNTLTGAMTGSNKFYQIQFSGAGSWTFGANAADVGANFAITSGTVTAPSTTLQVAGWWNNSGGTFTNNGGTVVMNSTVAGNFMLGTMTGASKFNNLTFNGVGGTWTFGANSADVAGNFTITNGTVTAPSTTLQIAGNYSNSGTFTNNNGTVDFNGSAGSFTLSGTMTGTSGFATLGFNGTGASYSFGANAASCTGFILTATAGTITAPSTTLTVAGSWQHSGAATFTHNSGTVNITATSNMIGTMTGASSFNILNLSGAGASYIISNNVQTAGNFSLTAGSVTTAPLSLIVGGSYSSSAGTTFAAAGSASAYSVTGGFTNGGTITLAAASSLAVTGSFSNTGTFNSGTTCTINVSGSWSNTGNFSASTSTVTMNGVSSGLTLSGNMTGTNKFNLLVFNGIGGGWTLSNNVDVGSNFTITNGSVTTPASHILNVLGNFTNAGSFIAGTTSTINVGSASGGSWNAVGGSFTASTSTVNMLSTIAGQTLTGNMTGANKFNNLVFNGATGAWSFGANAADVGGNFTITAGTVTAPSTTLQIAGSYTNNGTFTNNNGTVVMNGTSAGLTLSGSMTTTNKFNVLTFNGVGGSWTFSGAADVGSNFTITNGTVTAPSATLQIAGNYSNSGTFTNNSGTVVMNGTSAGLTLSGNMTTTNKFNLLTFNGVGGSWTFSSAADVGSNFTVTAGTVTTPTTTLNITGNMSNSGTLIAGATGTINVGGNWGNSGTFTAGTSQVNMNGPGAGLTLSGTLSGASKFNNLTMNGTGSWSFSNPTDVGGNFIQSSGTVTSGPSTFNITGNFSITGGSFTSSASAAINVGGSWLNNGTFTANSSTVTFNGSGAGNTISGTLTAPSNFFNISFTGTGSWSFGATSATATGSYSQTNGTVTAPSTTFLIGQNWSHTGGTFNHNNGTVTFNVGPSTISGTLLVGANKFNNVSFTGGSTYTFSNNADFNGNFTNTLGTVNPLSGGTYNITGSFSNAGTFNGSVVSSSLFIATNYSNTGTFNAGAGTVTMNGVSSGLTLSGNMTGTNKFNLLVFNGIGGGWTLSNNVDVGSNFTITNGSVTTPASHILNVLGNFTNAGSFIAGTTSTINVGSASGGSWNAVGGSFTASTSTVNMLSTIAGQTLTGNMTGANKFNNLVFNGATGAWSFGANAADVGGNFTITAGTVTAPSTTLQIAGSYTNNGTFTNNNGTVVMNGTSAGLTLNGRMTAALSSKFNNLTFNGAGGSWSFTNNIDCGNFTITQGTVTAPSSAFTFQVSGNWSNNTGTFTNNGGTVTMNGTTAGLTLTGSMTGVNKFNNLTFSGSSPASWTFGANNADVGGNFAITSNGTVTAPSTVLNIAGNYSNSGTFTNNGGQVNMNGTTAGITLSGNLSGTSKFNNLTMNGTGTWSFLNPTDVGGNFIQSSGTVTSGPSTFNVTGNFSITGGSFTAGASSAINVGGSWLNNGTFTANSSTVTFNGSAAGNTIAGTLVAPSNFFNISFTGTGSWTFGSTAATATGSYSQTNGTVTAPSTTFLIGQNWSHTGGTFNHNNGTVTFNVGPSTISGTLLVGANKFNNVSFTGGSTYTFSNNADFNGNFTNTSGTVNPLSGGTYNITGSFSNAGTFNGSVVSSSLFIATNYSNTGTFNAGAGTVTMNGVSSGLTLSGNMTGTNQFNLLTFNGIGGGWTLSNNVDVGSNFTITNGSVTTPANHILNIGTGGTGNFTNSGSFVAGTTSAINITAGNWNNTGGIFTASTSTVTMSGATAGKTFTGNMTGVSKFNNLTFTANSPATYTFAANPADVGGNFTISGTCTVTTPTTTLNIFGNMVNSGTLTSGAAGTINLGSATAGTGNWTNNNIFNASTGTVKMVGTVAGITLNGILSGVTGRFNNLTFNGPGGSFTFNANADVSSNTNASFTITAGTVTTPASHVLNVAGNWFNAGTYNAGATSSINVGGNSGTNCWTNSGTFNASTSTVTFNSTLAGTRTLTGAMTGTNKFYNLTFAGTLTTVIYTFGATPADVGNNFTISGLNKVTAPSSTLQIAGSFANTSGSFTHNSGTVNMNGTVAGLTLSGNMTASTNSRFNNLTFNGVGGGWTFINNAEAQGNFTITNGSVTAPSSGSLTVFGNWLNNGTFTHNSSTVFMSGTTAGLTLGGTLTGASMFNTLDFNGSGTFSFITPNATLYADYIQTAGTVTAPSGTLSVGGNWTHTGGTYTHNNGNVVMTGTTAGPYTLTSLMTGANSFYNLQFNSIIPIAAWNFSANAQAANNFTISNGTVTAPSSGTLTIGGSYSNGGTFTHNNSTVLMNGTSTGLTLSGNLSASALSSAFYNLTFNGVGGGWTMGSATDVLGAFNITNGSVTAPATTLQVAGNWTNSGTYNHNNGTVNLNGTTLQAITGATTFNNLTLNNTAGFALASDETVNGQLTMTAGLTALGNNNLWLGPAAPAISGTFSNTNMIIANTGGTVRKQMTANGSFQFPVGDNSSNYSPITINFTGGIYSPGAYYSIKVTPAKDPNNANLNNYLKRYWTLATSNIASPAYAATSATYVPADVQGTESLLSGGQWSGSLPWLKFAPVNTATHSLATTTVNSNTSDFTGITTQPPTVTSVPSSVTICNGQSTTISTTGATGDPMLTYTWAPSSGLSATIGTAVIASPTVTTVYTVTITDGNGFTAFSTTTVNVNPIPTPITGVATICQYFTSAMGSTPPGGTWSVNNPFLATIDPVSGVVTGMYPGNPVITYTLPTGCLTTQVLTINPSPAGISGTPSVCVGGATTLMDATGGGVWTNTSLAVATISSSGVVTGLAAGTSNVTYTLASDGCFAMTTVTVNPLPNVYAMTPTGASSYCAGSAGVDIRLTGSDNGVTYNLYNGSTLAGSGIGTGVAFDFGPQAAIGTYTVSAVTGITGCTSNMTGSLTVSVNPLPAPHTVSGGGGYCLGSAGVDICIDVTDPGVLYTLMQGGIPVSGVSPLVGNGAGQCFGMSTYSPGTYTVQAQDASTGCSRMMNGSATVTLNLPPTAYTVTGGGNYCSGGAGVHIGLNPSSTGVNYELFNSSGTTGIIVAGTGTAIDFGLITTADPSYSVVATNTSTSCTNTMTGTVAVGINPLPAVETVSAGGGYCAGGSGVVITLNPSDPTVNYQLIYGTSPVGGVVAGTGGLISFAPQTVAGNYTVLATDMTTHCTNTMSGTAVVSITPLPTVYNLSTPGGVNSYCPSDSGVHLILSGSDTGVNYDLYNGHTLLSSMAGTGSALDFGLQTLAGAYSVVATNLSTTCTNNMASSVFITINTPPAAYTVTGGGTYCAGGTGFHVGLSYSVPGVNYRLYRDGNPVGSLIAGMNSSIDFGVQTIAGVYTVVAFNMANGCDKLMTGSATIVVNTPPAAYTLSSSSSSFCAGGTGVAMMLNGSEPGVDYQLYNGSLPVGSVVHGGGSSLSFGSVTSGGTYTIVGRNITNGCTTTMSGSPAITMNALPTAYAVTGSGNYCAGGTGVTVGLSGSASGVQYQLFNGATPVGAPANGNGSAITFGVEPTGTYTVLATNLSTTCTNAMSGSAVVNANTLPAVFTVTGGGSYCSGTSGSDIGLSGSELGVNYQLYVGGSPSGAPIPGTGHVLDFGFQAVAGTYSVIATNAATGCTNNMAGTAVVSAIPAPNAYTVFGGGGFCVGGTGVHVRLSGSDAGVNYQLFNSGTAEGGLISGTTGPIDFGVTTTAGNYAVIATDPVTSCSSVMIHTVTVTPNPLPTAYAVTGGGNYCAGGPGVHVGIATAAIGVDYQLYDGSSLVDSAHGAGTALDFGLKAAAGTYTVAATDVTTGCRNSMTGSVSVAVTPSVTPSATIATAESTVCFGSYISFSVSPVNGGGSPSYQWQVNGTNVAVGNTFTYSPLNGDLVDVVMNSSAACALPSSTTSNSIRMTVNPVQMPAALLTANPGSNVCGGTPVTFSVVPTYGGANPSYTWLKNNTVVSTGTASYTYVPSQNDVVIVVMGSDFPCRLKDTVFSNDIVMKIDPANPTVTITSDHGAVVPAHRLVTLTANVNAGGSNPSYQWYVNGIALTGETNSTLVSDQFNNGDSISVRVITNGVCGSSTIFNSLIIGVSSTGVNTVSAGTITAKIQPNPNKGAFTLRGALNSKANEQVSVEITDMLGQVVYKGKVMSRNGIINEMIQLPAGTASGMYILALHSGDASATFHVAVEQ